MNFVGTKSLFDYYIINVICQAGGQYGENCARGLVLRMRTDLGW